MIFGFLKIILKLFTSIRFERINIMRMRRKKHGAERLFACGDVILPEGIADPSALFGRNAPLHVEIGCGKGDFICGTAEKNPGTDFIAIERIPDVLMLAAEKVKEKGLSNVRLAVMNAADLMNRLPAHSVERIYLNFSDPWPKKGYAKRRLTHRGFLQIYRGILAPGGGIYMKTDDNALFEFSLEELPACGFAVTDVTRDLHESGYASDNVMTEYERNFSAQGKKINMLRAVMKEDGNE